MDHNLDQIWDSVEKRVFYYRCGIGAVFLGSSLPNFWQVLDHNLCQTWATFEKESVFFGSLGKVIVWTLLKLINTAGGEWTELRKLAAHNATLLSTVSLFVSMIS